MLWAEETTKPSFAFSFYFRCKSSLSPDCRLWQCWTTVAFRLLARQWGECYYVSVLPSVCLVGTQLCCVLHHVLPGTHFHFSRAHEQNICTGLLLLDDHVSQNVATRLLNCDMNSICLKRTTEREEKGRVKSGTACSIWLIWHCYLWIHHRCFHTTLFASLLAYFFFSQPANIPSHLHSTTLFFPCVALCPSPPIMSSLISHLWLVPVVYCPIPAPPMSIYSNEEACAVFFIDPVNIFHISSSPSQLGLGIKPPQVVSHITHKHCTLLCL